jgi:hypothetical protein
MARSDTLRKEIASLEDKKAELDRGVGCRPRSR